MTTPRYDKYEATAGGYRAPLAADLSFTNGSIGPIAVSLNSSGQVVVGTAGATGFVGILVKNVPNYPNLGSIAGQPNIAVPMGGKAGNIVDVMTAGEISDTGLASGTKYYAGQDGTLSSNSADGPCVGWTVQSGRLVVRCNFGASGAGGGGTTALGTPVANTVTETPIQTLALDANEVTPGSIYKLTGFGVVSDTGTPTLTFTARLGGIAGTSIIALPAITLASSVTNAAFDYELTVNFQSATKATAKLKVNMDTSTTTDATGPFTAVTSAQVTVDTSTNQTLGVDVTWSAASASNTLTVVGAYEERSA